MGTLLLRRACVTAAGAGKTDGIVVLGEPGSTDSDLVGAKAANLARAMQGGLPVLAGFVVTPAAADALRRLVDGRPVTPPAAAATRAVGAAWRKLSAGGTLALVVRSSSEAEDSATSSMAGLFTSVVDVSGWPAFVRAVGTVAASGAGLHGEALIPVLVQPFLDAARGGVLFGLDPVTGRTDRRLVSVVTGGPQGLVSGTVAGTRYLLSPRGRLIEAEAEAEADTEAAGPRLTRRQRRALVDLGGRADKLFGGPQDIEWAMGGDGRLWLLQSRPVTAAAAPATGPVLGPGPVAETFPDALSALEESLWVDPLRRAMVEALHLAGSASRRRLAASPVVTSVGGRVAVDLELAGVHEPGRGIWARLDPRPALRRLAAAWRVGRLRAALPGLGTDVMATVDTALAAVPSLRSLDEDALLRLLTRSRDYLVAVHGHEMLAGLLRPDEEGTTTASAAALAAVAAGRGHHRRDDEIVAASPVALALTVPRVGPEAVLPEQIPRPLVGAVTGEGDLSLRESLRLRARWLHELGARSAWELGRRLTDLGVLDHPAAVGDLTLDQLTAVIAGHPLPTGSASAPRPVSAPLPAKFRLTAIGGVVPVAASGRRHKGGDGTPGRGAGGGRGMGLVHGGPEPAPPGAVLVVPTLDPRLAAVLPGLGGLVAETGSELSHLAILAREYGVPTVVGVPDAVRRFPSGTLLLVDGTSGEVTEQPGQREAS